MKELKKKAVKRTILDMLKIIGCVVGGCVLIVCVCTLIAYILIAGIIIPHFWIIAVGLACVAFCAIAFYKQYDKNLTNLKEIEKARESKKEK